MTILPKCFAPELSSFLEMTFAIPRKYGSQKNARTNSYRWERYLPKRGELFDQVTTYLINKGIKSQGATFNMLAEKVIERITESKYILLFLTNTLLTF